MSYLSCLDKPISRFRMQHLIVTLHFCEKKRYIKGFLFRKILFIVFVNFLFAYGEKNAIKRPRLIQSRKKIVTDITFKIKYSKAEHPSKKKELITK